MAASGTEIAQEFETALAAMPGHLRLSSGLWGRYLRGEVLPQGSVGRDGPSLVVRIDRALPGTASTFYHPVWELLDFRRLIGPDELRDLYLSMGEEVWRGMVDLRTGGEQGLQQEVFHFWRNRRLLEKQSLKIRSMATLDGVAAALIEARMAYFAQDRSNFLDAMMDVSIQLTAASESELFQTLRMKSALLIVKGIWLQEMGRFLIDPPALQDSEKYVRGLLVKEMDEWHRKCDALLKALPRHMATQFRVWRRQVELH